MASNEDVLVIEAAHDAAAYELQSRTGDAAAQDPEKQQPAAPHPDSSGASASASEKERESQSQSQPPGTTTTNEFRDQQSQVLPHRKLMIVFPVLALAQFTAYLDQTSISAAVPSIGADMQLGPSLTWVASSYLLATTAVQLVNGRLSDIFGRKRLLLISLGILATGNLVCGFSRTPGMLFTFRAMSGLGGGAMCVLLLLLLLSLSVY